MKIGIRFKRITPIPAPIALNAQGFAELYDIATGEAIEGVFSVSVTGEVNGAIEVSAQMYVSAFGEQIK